MGERQNRCGTTRTQCARTTRSAGNLITVHPGRGPQRVPETLKIL